MPLPVRTTVRRAAVAASAVGLIAGTASACTSSSSQAKSAAALQPLTKVTLQLQWTFQGQFAGYLAAAAEGFYRQEGLDVKILNGGPDIVSENTVADGTTDFAVAWPSGSLAAREQGANLVDVAQVFQRPSLQEYTLKKEGIGGPADLRGKSVGVNGGDNDVDVLAGLTKAGLNPSKDVTLVQQNGSIAGLFNGTLDAVQGSSYNEYGQILATKNPATGKLYTPADIGVIDWGTYGTGLLEDGIWANSTKLAGDPAYQKETQEFVTASLEGWIYCRDHVVSCRDIVVKAGSNLGASLQLFQVNSVNSVIWPSPAGVGMIDSTTWNQTISTLLHTESSDGSPYLKSTPAPGGYTNTYVEKALTTLKSKGLDVYGTSYKPISVTLQPNGD